MRNRFRRWLLLLEKRLRKEPLKPDLTPVVRDLAAAVMDAESRRDLVYRDNLERAAELMEAHAISGAGPWLPASKRESVNDKKTTTLRESMGSILSEGVPVEMREAVPVSAIGSTGDLELALQNVEWRREVQLSWLEFSRWGIQQIILICRLYTIKHPIIRRLVNVIAYYVFGRGVEISSEDPQVNEAIEEFLKLNQSELSQPALAEHQKRILYDGNLFFMFFPDTQNTGAVKVRSVDATEIMDIITNPDDASEEWFFRRSWSPRVFDVEAGTTKTKTDEAWYPSIHHDPQGSNRVMEINGHRVIWETPILHRKYGAVGKWLFGCPELYPAIDWAKAARRYLEACMTLAASLAQFSSTITTKGGQQAMAGVKNQLQTTVGPTTQVFDTNPTAVDASVFVSGPGTKLEAFHSRAMALDPKEYRPIATMAAIALDVPPTWIGDMETSNLATATTLDRPTELAMKSRQEGWKSLLVEMVVYALKVQVRATGGKLREALTKKGIDIATIQVCEAPKKQVTEMGRTYSVYLSEADRKTPKAANVLEVRVDFPEVREGDLPQLATALATAMTLGNRGGQIVGIDEKAGVLKLMELFGIEGRDKLIEEMYPSTNSKDAPKYDPNRTGPDDTALKPPISSKPPYRTGPQAPGGHPQPAPKEPTPGQEALRRLGRIGERMVKIAEKRRAA